MRRFSVAVLLIALFAPLGCRATDVDPFVPAQKSLEQGDLLRALTYLDQLPPAHPHYAEARAIAQAVERRMRTAQRLIARGMDMRAEWRDEEAIHFFEQAGEVWSQVAGAEELILATEARIRALEPAPAAPVEGPAQFALETQPVRANETMPVLDEESGTPAGPSAETAEALPPDPLQTLPVAPETGVPTPAEVEARLRRGREHLAAGRLEPALDTLEGLFEELPAHPDVVATLIRILHQRALLHYGQGELELSIADWTRVLQLDARHRQASEFLAAAQAELRSQKR